MTSNARKCDRVLRIRSNWEMSSDNFITRSTPPLINSVRLLFCLSLYKTFVFNIKTRVLFLCIYLFYKQFTKHFTRCIDLFAIFKWIGSASHVSTVSSVQHCSPGEPSLNTSPQQYHTQTLTTSARPTVS